MSKKKKLKSRVSRKPKQLGVLEVGKEPRLAPRWRGWRLSDGEKHPVTVIRQEPGK